MNNLLKGFFTILLLVFSMTVSAIQYVVIEQGGDGNSAPLRVAPNEMTSIARIQAGVKLEVISEYVVPKPTKYMPTVTWYKVEYNGLTGWISEYVTVR
ncbi:hypothetical protein [uncultured Gammaproteobacteria bacterium]|jgi:hypothetical protein|nr:hypothetical protein [uncultured Gammaproteobacteria bacterium]CAC9540985.1 hypothetical protein [uncultured Gammaproteobacteria bacterium]CAC9546345.1 hypothetical protein [uncultured Gammaproteobacteria bacterium]CAC9551342.1 hypothetical protein [uncultured Gammaproteobacteria bacterium]CAC9952007.1 hypothetical protein [uncultured Gammaproteobacteria bacterium]